jgi:hypothetical protein
MRLKDIGAGVLGLGRPVFFAAVENVHAVGAANIKVIPRRMVGTRRRVGASAPSRAWQSLCPLRRAERWGLDLRSLSAVCNSIAPEDRRRTFSICAQLTTRGNGERNLSSNPEGAALRSRDFPGTKGHS